MNKLNLYTASDVANKLGVTVVRVYQLRRSRNTGTLIGKQWLFSDDDIARMQPDAKHRRKDYAAPPSPRVRREPMADALAAGVWAVADGVMYIARQDGDAFAMSSEPAAAAATVTSADHIVVNEPSEAEPVPVVQTYPDRESIMARMRQIEPDLRKWRAYA